ncbi:hypothetical protein GOB94_04600 [Granulicella sp. 5B5]|uniref:hypothetical protein n=1 Tax=Granulicella sp. 5B5 TaxID=1617967 RepID=UPI0015F5B81B|nr:hypothetical protein [Granulicella sp. 5B5]QMV18047.1 hypothetical protein GOB94_04600 [Granulicella sp. 5B5]
MHNPHPQGTADVTLQTRIQLPMNIDDIEQKRPNGPNFGLIVILFCVTILVVFVLSLFFVRFDGHHLHFLHHKPNPNASLILPASFNA